MPVDREELKPLKQELTAFKVKLLDGQGLIFTERALYTKLKVVLALLLRQLYQSQEDYQLEQQRILMPVKLVPKKRGKYELQGPSELQLKALTQLVKERDHDRIIFTAEAAEQ